jgi:hypothetical protein
MISARDRDPQQSVQSTVATPIDEPECSRLYNTGDCRGSGSLCEWVREQKRHDFFVKWIVPFYRCKRNGLLFINWLVLTHETPSQSYWKTSVIRDMEMLIFIDDEQKSQCMIWCDLRLFRLVTTFKWPATRPSCAWRKHKIGDASENKGKGFKACSTLFPRL